MNRFVLALLLLAGCTPAAVYHLDSREPDIRWFHGQELIRRESGGVSFVVSFHRCWSSYLVFDVEVINRSDSAILVEPEKFYYQLSVKYGDLEAALQQKFMAVNPETQLHMLDKQVSSEDARHQTFATMDAIAGVADLVVDIAEAGERTAREEDQDARRDFERAADRHTENVEYERTITNLGALRAYWASQVLRKTHLGPRQSVSGKIAMATFPIDAFLKGTFNNHATLRIRTDKVRPVYMLTMRCPVADSTFAVDFMIKKL